MSNMLMKTNTLWYKIKKIFRKIFNKKEVIKNHSNNIITKDKTENDFIQRKTLKEQFKEENIRMKLARDIIENKISIDSLTDEQVDEMIEYFLKYITDIKVKINEIKIYKKTD